MRHLTRGPVIALLLGCAVVSCRPDFLATTTRPRTSVQPVAQVSPHVVIVSIDGLRPDAITPDGMPTLHALAKEGSHTFAARTILPSITLPSHTSMLTGVGPSVHGITWNSDETRARGTVRVPTVFGIAHARGLRTAAFFSKTKFHHLEVNGTLDHGTSPDGDDPSWSGAKMISDVVGYLEVARPNLLFVHIGDTDYAGHGFGWMSPRYLRAALGADEALGRLRGALDRAFGVGSYTLIVTADHGGHGRGHGSADARDVMIPWVVHGRGVAAGTEVSDDVRTMDTAATALWLLGVPVPSDWEGVPVARAFNVGALASAGGGR